MCKNAEALSRVRERKMICSLVDSRCSTVSCVSYTQKIIFIKKYCERKNEKLFLIVVVVVIFIQEAKWGGNERKKFHKNVIMTVIAKINFIFAPLLLAFLSSLYKWIIFILFITVLFTMMLLDGVIWINWKSSLQVCCILH